VRKDHDIPQGKHGHGNRLLRQQIDFRHSTLQEMGPCCEGWDANQQNQGQAYLVWGYLWERRAMNFMLP
jgi:hypothetical protein